LSFLRCLAVLQLGVSLSPPLSASSDAFSTNPPPHGASIDQGPSPAAVVGADMSMLSYYESIGTTYRDGGKADDALQILKRRGFNCVRLRLFSSTADQAFANPRNYFNTLEHMVPLAARVRQAGMLFMLDFHYSDTWADPAHQSPPSGWTNLSASALVQEMRRYTSNCIHAFRLAKAMPDFVQIGNEITPGFLWPLGAVGGTNDHSAQWGRFAQLLKAGRQGVADAAGDQMPRIIIHIDRGGDWEGTKWFFDRLLRQEVEFDIIGQSYYATWHGPLNNLSNCLVRTGERYKKPILVVETGFPWASNRDAPLSGFPTTLKGQADYATAFVDILKSVPGNLVFGALWWGAEYPGSWNSLFDSKTNVVPAASTFGRLAGPIPTK